MSNVYTPPQALDGNGDPIVGADIFRFFEAGTTAPLEVFAENDLTTSLGTSVDTNSYGFAPQVYFPLGKALKVRLHDAAGNLIRETDHAQFVGVDQSQAANIGFSPTEEIPETNLQDALESSIDNATNAVSDALGEFPTAEQLGLSTVLYSLDRTDGNIPYFEGNTLTVAPTEAYGRGILDLDSAPAMRGYFGAGGMVGVVTVAGLVAADGTALAGTGFTVVKENATTYLVNFSVARSNANYIPSVTITDGSYDDTATISAVRDENHFRVLISGFGSHPFSFTITELI